jgi:hypothetical protein
MGTQSEFTKMKNPAKWGGASIPMRSLLYQCACPFWLHIGNSAPESRSTGAHHSASARRPASVLPASPHALGVGVGEPGAHELGQHPTLKPFARRAPSVHPLGLPASTVSVCSAAAAPANFGRTSAPIVPHFVQPSGRTTAKRRSRKKKPRQTGRGTVGEHHTPTVAAARPCLVARRQQRAGIMRPGRV